MKTEFQELTTPDALAAVRELAARIWPRTYAPILSPEQIAYMMQMMYDPAVMARELASGHHFEILKLDGLPAGYLVYSAYAGHPGAAKLHKVYLDCQYHGRGFGQLMLNHAQTQCRQLGFRNLVLTVNKQNAAALRAYKRNGFERIDAVKTPIGNGFFMDDYILCKPL